MRKRNVFLVVFSLLLLLLPITYLANARNAEKNAPAPLELNNQPLVVKTYPVKPGQLAPTLKLNGTVYSHKEIPLFVKSPGTLVALNVRNGDRVQAGQTVAQIETRNQQLHLDKANEQVTAARLAREKAEKDFARVEALYHQGVVSAQEFEEVEYFLQSAVVAHQVALQDQQLALKALEDTRVLAPIPGRVTDCQAEAGQVIFAGSPLMTLIDDTQLKIIANLTAEQLKWAKVGQTAIFQTSVYPEKTFSCKVKNINPKANPANRTFTAECTLPPETADFLKPGMFGYLKLEIAPIEGLLLPREALLTLDETGGAEVFVATEDQAYKKQLKTGLGDSAFLTVLEGLDPDDRVIIVGQHQLKDGSLIKEEE